MDGSVISIDMAKQLNIVITGSKDFIYPKCENCIHCYFSVAIGLNSHYGWYVQCCSVSSCSPLYKSVQLSLF